jgi:hypothetical protein
MATLRDRVRYWRWRLAGWRPSVQSYHQCGCWAVMRSCDAHHVPTPTPRPRS